MTSRKRPQVMPYPFSSIWINGRVVDLEAIARGTERTNSDFEAHTFSFIRQWLSGQQVFSLQTSGSTGEPKTIDVDRAQMIASAEMTASYLGLCSGSDALVCIDTRYVGGKMMLVRSLLKGLQIWALDPMASPLEKLPAGRCVNFAAFVPYQVEKILGSKHPHLLDNVAVSIIGGAPMSDSLIHQLTKTTCRCYAAYGMTETISHVALRCLNGEGASQHYHALPGVTLDADPRGCLVIEAPFLAGKVITNDMAELISPTMFRWLGRWDNVINTGGIKVNPEKIEAAIGALLAGANISGNFFVHGVEDQQLGERLVIVAESSGNISNIIREIYPRLAAAIPRYEVPKEIHIAPSFLYTATGKIKRRESLGAVEAIVPLRQ